MSDVQPPKGLSWVWPHYRWRAGLRLDRMGRWLLAHAPTCARVYAWLLSGGRPRLERYPGWTFAAEYFIEQTWFAQRRGALWEFALEHKLVVPLRVRWHEGLTIGVTLGNDHSLCLYVGGTFEPNEFDFLGRVLKPGMTVVDAGANEGLYTLFAARRVGSSGRVVAFEPSSRERAGLERNVRRNRLKNVTVVPSALGSVEGEAGLRIAADLHSGHNTLGSFVYDDAVSAHVEKVQVERLDSVVARLALRHVDLIKIDVEGAEVNLLEGAEATLTAHRPVLLLEANDEALRAQGTSADALVALLRGRFRYEILVFSPRTGGVEPLVDGTELSPNVVAVPAERLAEILALV